MVVNSPAGTVAPPKREKHKRTISIDDALVRLLLSVREQHLRLVAGVPNNVDVDLSLIKLPEGALMFPSLYGRDIDLTRLRRSNTVTRYFEERARKRFPDLRFHDLRGSHETALLDAGCRCIRLPLVVVTILQSFCVATPSGRRSPIRPLPTSSATCRKPFWNSLGPKLGPVRFPFASTANENKFLESIVLRYPYPHPTHAYDLTSRSSAA